MPASLIEGESLLAVDVGGATTRAVLLDIVEGQYRLVAASTAASTATAPFKDVSAGVRAAIESLQKVTGRTMLDDGGRLITPAQADGSGIDAFVSTLSAGPILRTMVLGLLPDVSVESARRLAETCYVRIVDSAGLTDPRPMDQQIDSLMRLQPDAVVIAGGTDGGASRSVQKILEPIGLSSFLLAPDRRPAVLFAGNQKLHDEVREQLANVTSSLHFSPNVRPSLDTEDLGPASHALAGMFMEIRKRQLRGIEQLEAWSGGNLLPTAYAEGRMIRLLSSVYGGKRASVLGIDIGATAAVIAAGFRNSLTLRVYPQFGLGENLPGLLQHSNPEEILRWSPVDVSAGELRDYLYQKALYPSSIAATSEDQNLAQSVARQALYLAMHTARRDFPPAAGGTDGVLPHFEPIIASGGALSQAPSPAHGLLLLLDAIQPTGITSIILDGSNLLPLLGAAAERNTLVPIQVLDSGAFQSLGTVCSFVGSAHHGATIARVRLVDEHGAEKRADIKYGNLELLQLPNGRTAKLSIQPRHGINAGFGPGRAGSLTVSGGLMGVVFDARGRPLALPRDDARRRELLKKWHWTMGA